MSLPTTYSEDKVPEQIQPEELEIADTYLRTGDISETAEMLNIPRNEVVRALNKKPVKEYVDSIFNDIGYLNRFKLADIWSKIIDRKMEELDEAEIGSAKDIVEILDKATKFVETMNKLQASRDKTGPGKQTNVQINEFGETGNYGALLQHLFNGGK